MKEYEAYTKLGSILREKVANALRVVARGDTIERLKRMGRFHGHSPRQIKASMLYDGLSNRVDIGNEFSEIVQITTGYTSFRFPTKIFDAPENEWPGFMIEKLLEEQQTQLKRKTAQEYNLYCSLRARFEKPKEMDWKVIDELLAKKSNRLRRPKKITSFKTK